MTFFRVFLFFWKGKMWFKDFIKNLFSLRLIFLVFPIFLGGSFCFFS